MNKILFVCSGNVGRSQMAEAFYNNFSHTNNASSAGIDPTTPQRYINPTKEVIQVMTEEDIDISKNVVKTLDEEMVKRAEIIYILCEKELCPNYLRDSSKTIFWKISDPFQMNIAETRKIRDIIKEKVKSILN